jgi:hypothetical protein
VTELANAVAQKREPESEILDAECPVESLASLHAAVKRVRFLP